MTIQGSLIADFASQFAEGTPNWLNVIIGKLTCSETIVKGFDKLLEAFYGLFEGKNEGKIIVEIYY
jgi:NADPH-dependent curcumin reductase CurA